MNTWPPTPCPPGPTNPCQIPKGMPSTNATQRPALLEKPVLPPEQSANPKAISKHRAPCTLLLLISPDSRPPPPQYEVRVPLPEERRVGPTAPQRPQPRISFPQNRHPHANVPEGKLIAHRCTNLKKKPKFSHTAPSPQASKTIATTARKGPGSNTVVAQTDICIVPDTAVGAAT